MRHHYWELPIFVYLFLGGLGGGIMFLSMIFTLIMAPGSMEMVQVVWLPMLVAIACLALGCFFLVFELGQPFAFLRVFLKNTSIICWGARFLTVAMLAAIVWWVAYLPYESVEWLWPFQGLADALRVAGPVCMVLAGVAGFCIMVYTGVMLSTLKAHSFWATPALPVLFTVSALSTACAGIMLFAGIHPEGATMGVQLASTFVHEQVHEYDIVLVIAELTVLFVMILSFLGSGNKVQNQVAHRWIHGSYALAFWGGMICIGLGIPEIINIFCGEVEVLTHIVAPIMVLCGGLLLRAMCIFSDDRAEIPGEIRYFTKLKKKGQAEFLTRWDYNGQNEF
ncbi:MAG: polysulfide reductase NrfD [Coriobacteriia bacterium]|nr:polysulfide reductase NrfD [Coriobacteriia bacterium]